MSEPLLLREAADVTRFALRAHQHELTEPHAGVDAQRTSRDVAHLEHLAVVDARLHERRRHVDHQAEAREAAASLEEAAQIPGKTDALARDAMDRRAGR